MKRRITITLAVLATVSMTSHQAASAGDDKAKTSAGKPKLADRVYVKMTTSKGDIVLELNQEKAPITVKNFLRYANEKFYDGTIFHRVISNFMIQGGGFDTGMNKKKTHEGIKNEWKNNLKNTRGTIAMARLGGQPDSASSQFFINVVDNGALDVARDGAAYAVFGRVVQGMDVVDKIRAVKTKQTGPYGNVPAEAIVINKVTRLSDKEAKAMKEAAAAQLQAANRKTLDAAAAFLKQQGVDVGKAVVSDTGLWYVDTKVGDGPTPTKSDTAEVHYTGWLANGSKFDSSRDRGQPFPVSLRGGVIQGWLEGLATMKVGGTRYLIIPPELGYGARGSGPRIPPNSILVFEVEMLRIK